MNHPWPGEPIAVYAGADRSGLRRDGQWISVERDILKGSVRRRELRWVVATDAACEGLNLQTLGTLIRVDLPWNPSRLEQRIGRIKRIGQVRSTVDMLNLVYQGTRDEKVYERLSQRMKDRYDLFGGNPMSSRTIGSRTSKPSTSNCPSTSTSSVEPLAEARKLILDWIEARDKWYAERAEQQAEAE